MSGVLRLGGERTCSAFPPDGTKALFMELRGHPPGLSAQDGDDAEDGMGLYETKGALPTWCGELALYDLRSGELTVDCLACIANQGRSE